MKFRKKDIRRGPIGLAMDAQTGKHKTKLKEKRLGNGEEYEKMTNDQRLNWISEIMKEAMKEANGKGKGRKKKEERKETDEGKEEKRKRKNGDNKRRKKRNPVK